MAVPAPAQIPETDDGILAHLLVVACIRPGDKLSVRPLSINTGSMSAIVRWWNGECRRQTLEYLNTLLHVALRRLDVLSVRGANDDEVRLSYAKQYVAHISNAMTGVAALSMSYSGDPFTVSSLKTMVNGTQIRLNAYKM